MMKPGLVVLIGSGETASAAGQVYETIAGNLGQGFTVAVLETPAGFELNAAGVARKVADYLALRLQNYRANVVCIPARKQDGPFSTNNPEILSPLLESQLIFAGPGSPTFTVRQLQDSLAWRYILARHRLGAALVFASAASIAIGKLALPVYEIYKVGEDPHWKPGLDLLGVYGLSLVVFPHWNNSDGGAELDTSRCFMGMERFKLLQAQLPEEITILGIDEHTAVIMDLNEGVCHVVGRGAAHVLRQGEEWTWGEGESFPLEVMGDFKGLVSPEEGIGKEVWEETLAREMERVAATSSKRPLPDEVEILVQEREKARKQGQWGEADRIRTQLTRLGWEVRDTPSGPQLIHRG